MTDPQRPTHEPVETAPQPGTGRPSDRLEKTGVHADSRGWGRAWLLLVVVMLVGLTADLVSKRVAFERVADEPVVLDRAVVLGDPNFRLPWHEGVEVLPMNLLDLRLVLNHGAVFGIGNGRRGIFIMITIVAIAAALFVFRRWTTPADRWAHVGVALVLAGGLGNLYDRFVFGAVRDFLHMLPRWRLPFDLSWPGGNNEVFPWIFNFADVFLLVGMALLILTLHRNERELSSDPPNAAPKPNAGSDAGSSSGRTPK